MDYEIFFSAYALKLLEAYVSSRGNAQEAAKHGKQLLDKITALSRNPQRGRMAPEFRRPDLREVPYNNQRIVYRVNDAEACVEILGILLDRECFRARIAAHEAPALGPHRRS